MNSTRLPSKVLKEINGLPLIVHIYRRLLACRELDGVVVSWGGEAGRDQMREASLRYALRWAMVGPKDDDLISRHQVASIGYDAFVRITADCLFHDPQLIDNMVATYRNRYPKVRGLSNRIPYRTVSEGLDCEIVSSELLAQLDRDPQCPRETFCTYAEEKGYLSPYPPAELHRYPIGQDLHLSIDTPEDFARAEKMLKILGNDEWRYEETLKAYRATA